MTHTHKPEPRFVPLTTYREYPKNEMLGRAERFYQEMNRRRTIRTFSDRPVALQLIEHCLRTAGTAPSGAHIQPWHFVVVSDPEVKRRIREAAEREERAFYRGGKAPQEWLDALAPLGTDENKPYLETAPYLIVVFAKRYGTKANGERMTHYYVQESVGLATGFLIAAVHMAGLASLTHTPNPMGFLNTILNRPDAERAFLILVVGYPADGTAVPDLTRKALGEIATFV